MRRRQLAVLLALTVMLAGCGGGGASGADPDAAGAGTGQESHTEGNAEAGTDAESAPGTESGKDNPGEGQEKAGAEEDAPESRGETGTDAESAPGTESGKDNPKEGQESILPEGIRQGRMLLEDGEAFYCCGTGQIRRIEKPGGETRILWEKDTGGAENDFSMEGKGILLGSHIYFLEEGQGEEGGNGRALSVVNVDGSGYHRVTGLEDFPAAFYYYDGALYLESDGNARSCPVEADGSVPDGEGMQELSFENVPKEYYLVNAWHGGSRYLGAFESLNTFGYYLMENGDMETVAIDPRTGEERVLPAKGRLRSFNRDYFLFSNYEEEGQELSLLDVHFMDAGPKDGESSGLRPLTVFEDADYQYGITVLDMDEEYVYIVAENPSGEPQGGSIYEEISLKTGETRELFGLGRQLGMERSYPLYGQGTAIRDGYVYYADSQDYKMYLMRRSLEDTQKAEVLGDAFYDSGISQVGKVEGYFERVNSEVRPDFVLLELDLERLVVDERFEGAQEINRVLTEYQENIIQYKKDEEGMEWQESELAALEEDEVPYSLSFSCSSYPSEISYFDGDYFSFRQMDYDYTGGAHGMPFWEGFTFDLHTGQRLLLSDVAGNSEEELKEIVVRYFDEYISETPEEFWEDALQVVEDGISLSSQFYLDEDGIAFYFEPYALASYAGGFKEVTIPYEEFEMKIG